MSPAVVDLAASSPVSDDEQKIGLLDDALRLTPKNQLWLLIMKLCETPDNFKKACDYLLADEERCHPREDREVEHDREEKEETSDAKVSSDEPSETVIPRKGNKRMRVRYLGRVQCNGERRSCAGGHGSLRVQRIRLVISTDVIYDERQV